MFLLQHIKLRRQRNLLRKMAAAPHKKTLPNLEHVRSIAIITQQPLSDSDATVLHYFFDHMNRRDIKVTHLSLPPADDRLWHNRLGLPRPESIASFTSHSYDIIIAATLNDDPRTLFTVLSTKASLRIAYDDTQRIPDTLSTNTYDLFIRGIGHCNLTHYLKEILTLLLKIKQ